MTDAGIQEFREIAGITIFYKYKEFLGSDVVFIIIPLTISEMLIRIQAESLDVIFS